MTTNSDTAGPETADQAPVGPNSNGHLVYIGMIPKEHKSLRIHIEEPSTKLEAYDREFVVDQQSMTVSYEPRVIKTTSFVKELGWFEDIGLFTQICMDQRVTAREGLLFDKWVEDVLARIAADYSTLWRRSE